MNQKDNVLSPKNISWLFWGCFIALVTTSFGFIIRAQLIGEWGVKFGLSETQKGEILGVGLWPFAISIVLFSLVIDKIGYGTSMFFAFFCQIVSAIVTISTPWVAKGDSNTAYWMLYVGNLIMALGNGTVEAVINPAVATIYSKAKTKWLSILHAGWPGGLVLGGILAISMGSADWRLKVALIFIPAVIYGFMLIRVKFPVQERVQAGVSYKTMLQEAGLIGAIIIIVMMTREVGRVFEWGLWSQVIIAGVFIVGYGAYVRSIGQPLFIFLMLIMIPLATAELGTDSWITELVTPIMGKHAGWLLVYTSLIMMILRFLAGSIVHRISPLGLLAVSSAIAIVGLLFLSTATAFWIFVAATIYGMGKSFFWPTMLGVVSERFPKGGALTMNTISGVGMLTVGIIGAAFLGNIQDKQIDKKLLSQEPAIHAQVVGGEKLSVFGKYNTIEAEKTAKLTPEELDKYDVITAEAKKSALATVAIFPTIMLVCYLILMGYFRAKGGYKAVEL